MSVTPAVRGSGGGSEPAGQNSGGGPLQGFTDYLQGVREELKKSTWPTRPELIQLTQVVLVIIFLVALYCGVLDAVLTVVTDWAFGNH